VPVQAGDIIGVYEDGGGCGSETTEAADTYAWVPATDEGLGTATYQALTKGEFPASALITVAPTASTSSASSVGVGGATLHGVVGPEESRTAYFQYGTSTGYGASTAHESIGASGGPSLVTASVSGLASGTTFHFRLVAENAGGVNYGGDQTFTTGSASSTTSTTLTTSTTSTTSTATAPVEKRKPVVNTATGEITLEYEFREAGEAEEEAQVAKGARVARAQAFATPRLGYPLATLATERKGDKCKKGFVKKGKKCVSNAPVRYGRASLAILTAGTYKLQVKPRGQVFAALKKGKTLHVALTLVFIPTGTDDHITETTSAAVHLEVKRKHTGKHKKYAGVGRRTFGRGDHDSAGDSHTPWGHGLASVNTGCAEAFTALPERPSSALSDSPGLVSYCRPFA
jgi:hypothetical protein